MSEFGDKIKSLLDEDEKSIAWLARKIDMPQTNLWRKLNQKEDPQFTPEIIAKMAHAFSLEISELLEMDKLLKVESFIQSGENFIRHLDGIEEHVRALKNLLGIENKK